MSQTATLRSTHPGRRHDPLLFGMILDAKDRPIPKVHVLVREVQKQRRRDRPKISRFNCKKAVDYEAADSRKGGEPAPSPAWGRIG